MKIKEGRERKRSEQRKKRERENNGRKKRRKKIMLEIGEERRVLGQEKKDRVISLSKYQPVSE